MVINALTGKPFCVIGLLDDILYECLKYECFLTRVDFLSWHYFVKKSNTHIFIFSYSAILQEFKLYTDSQNDNFQIKIEEILNYCNINNIKCVLWIDCYKIDSKLISMLDKKFDAVFSVCKSHIEKIQLCSKNGNIYYLPFAAQVSLFNPINKNCESIGIISSPEECLRMSCCYAFASCFYKKFDILSIQRFNYDEHHFVPNYIFDAMSCGKIVICPEHKYIKEHFEKQIKFANSQYDYDCLSFKYTTNKILCEKLSLINLRQIISFHTYEHRFVEILSKVNLHYLDKTAIDGVNVFCVANNYRDIYTAIYNYISQNVLNKHLVFIINANFICRREVEKIVSNLADVDVYFFDSLRSYYECIDKAIINSPFNYIAFFNAEDYYFPYYLTDALNCFVYSGCKIAGKKTILIYNKDDGSIGMRYPNQEEKYCYNIEKWTCVANKDVFFKVNIDLFLENKNKFWDLCNLYGFKVYSSNRFNYIHKYSFSEN